jgi:hypothetical protein
MLEEDSLRSPARQARKARKARRGVEGYSRFGNADFKKAGRGKIVDLRFEIADWRFKKTTWGMEKDSWQLTAGRKQRTEILLW